MNDKLLPCPFCGGEAQIQRSGAERHYSFRIACRSIAKCGATQYWFDGEAESITAWNRRTDS